MQLCPVYACETLAHGQKYFRAHVSELVARFGESLVYNASEDGTYLMDDNGDIILCDGDVVYIDYDFEDLFIVRVALDDVNFDDTVNVMEFNREQAEVLLDAKSEETKKLNEEIKLKEEEEGKKNFDELIKKYNVSYLEKKMLLGSVFCSDMRRYASRNQGVHSKKLIKHQKQFAAEILDID